MKDFKPHQIEQSTALFMDTEDTGDPPVALQNYPDPQGRPLSVIQAIDVCFHDIGRPKGLQELHFRHRSERVSRLQ